MKRIILALALAAAIPTHAQAPYAAKGWVWVDNQDHQGKWDIFRANDKRGHFVEGGLAASWVYLYADRQGWKHPEWWGIAAGWIIGYIKEIYDLKRGSGTAERADVLATGLGGMCAVPLVRIKW